MNRGVFAWVGCGALGAAVSIASACSSSNAPPGFGNTSGGSGSNNGSSSQGSSSNSGGNGSTYGGSTTGGNTGGTTTGNGNSTNTGSTTGGTTTHSTTSSTTGTTTGAGTTTGGGTGCGDAGSCSAPMGTGALPMTQCYQSTIGTGGYAFQFNDGVSTGCIDSTAICGAGTTTVAGPGGNSGYLYGAAVGFAVGQAAGTSTTPAVTPTATGLTLQFTTGSTVPNGMQVGLVSGSGQVFCAELPAALPITASTTIGWSSFNTLCFNTPPDGGAFSPADGIEEIQFQANSGTTAAAWNFCLSKVSF